MADGKIEFKHVLIIDKGLFFLNPPLLQSLKSLLKKNVQKMEKQGLTLLLAEAFIHETQGQIVNTTPQVTLSAENNKLIAELIKKASKNIITAGLKIDTLALTYTTSNSAIVHSLPPSFRILTDSYTTSKLNVSAINIKTDTEFREQIKGILETLEKGATTIAIPEPPKLESPKKDRRKSMPTTKTVSTENRSNKIAPSASSGNIAAEPQGSMPGTNLKTILKTLKIKAADKPSAPSPSPLRIRAEAKQDSTAYDPNELIPSQPQEGVKVIISTNGRESPHSSSERSLDTDTEESNPTPPVSTRTFPGSAQGK